MVIKYVSVHVLRRFVQRVVRGLLQKTERGPYGTAKD